MKKVEHTIKGRKYLVALPETSDNLDLGIVIGPPNFVDELELPEPFATRIHNQMYERGFFTLDALRRRPNEVQAALQSALRLDAARIVNAYAEAEKETLPFD